jgi:predicted outer membrane repeat protein
MKSVGLLVIVMLFLCSTTHATTWYVHPDSSLNTIQAGLDSCADNDIVLVGPGIYYENIVWPNMQGIHLMSEYGKDTTLIDGDSSGRVIYVHTGVDTTTVIDGFTIQNGYVAGGGGIYCWNSSPSLTNITITGNTASAGGGVYCNNSSPNLENVTISGNTTFAGGDGGGISCVVNSTPSLENVTISGNTASAGGGIYCDNSSPNLENVTISENTAPRGGGICCNDNSTPSLENVTISENTASGSYTTYGGGIYCWNSSPNLTNVTICENAVICPGWWPGGGGIYCGANSSPSLENVTICGNTTSGGGGGVHCDSSSPNLVNCILWNNSPEIYIYISGSVTATYSDIEGGWPGTGNIDADPMFESGPLGDYHLSSNSPCIDTGNPSPQYNDPEDPLNPGYALWPALGTVRNDMGVYGGPGISGWVGIEEQPANPVIERNTISATILAGPLTLPEGKKCRVYDITGRVMEPDKIQPGIYFIEIDGVVTQKVVKVR